MNAHKNGIKKNLNLRRLNLLKYLRVWCVQSKIEWLVTLYCDALYIVLVEIKVPYRNKTHKKILVYRFILLFLFVFYVRTL